MRPTATQALLHQAQARPKNAAFLFHGEAWTYEKIARQSDSLAHGMMARGVKPGDRVALHMINRPEFIVDDCDRHLIAALCGARFAERDDIRSKYKSYSCRSAHTDHRDRCEYPKRQHRQRHCFARRRFGVVQVVLRDRFAGPHTPPTASGKAWTAATFRSSTSDLFAISQPGMMQAGIRSLPGAVIIGGGLTVEAGGSLVGAIGVSGAPGGDADEACARAGIKAIQDKLDF
jgi:uncharacterized protein GlcG (DUF336 family)